MAVQIVPALLGIPPEKSPSRLECRLGTALLIAGGEGSSDHQTPEVAFEDPNPVYGAFPWAEAGRPLGAAGGNEFEATVFLCGEGKTADPKAGSALPCRGKIKLEVGVGRIQRRNKRLESTFRSEEPLSLAGANMVKQKRYEFRVAKPQR